MRAKQLSFLPAIPKHYGGDHLKGRRKTARPIDPKKPVHIVMRASVARGTWSMLAPKNRKKVDATVRAIATKRGLKLYRYTNIGNHLHLLVKTPSRKAFQAFLRELAGAIPMLITGARKGIAQKFWDARAFTRIVEWGKDLRNVQTYFIKNLFEAEGALTKSMKAQGVKLITLFGRDAPWPRQC